MSTHAPQQQSRSWGRWTVEDEASDAVTTEFTLAIPAPRQAPPPSGPVAVHAPAVPPTNGLAVAGMVIALVGAVVALVPVLGLVAWLLSPVGLVLSIAGVAAAGSRLGVGRGMGIAGVVLGVVGLLVCTAATLVVALAAATPAPYVPAAAPVVVAPAVPTIAAAPRAVVEDPVEDTSSAPVPTYAAPTYAMPSYSIPTYSGPTTTTRAVPTGSFGAGTYAVGERIQPGTYTTAGADYCYWARLSEADGELGSIIANDTATGPSTMVVKGTDAYVEFSGDCTWARK